MEFPVDRVAMQCILPQGRSRGRESYRLVISGPWACALAPTSVGRSALDPVRRSRQACETGWVNLAPVYPIRSARLLLRPLSEKDVDDLVEYRSIPEVCRYVPF